MADDLPTTATAEVPDAPPAHHAAADVPHAEPAAGHAPEPEYAPAPDVAAEDADAESDVEPTTLDEPDAAADESDAAAEPEVPAEPVPPPTNKKWYVVKVTSGREESIKAAIERRVKIEGLEEFFGQVVIPVERVTEVKKVRETKNGEKITKEKRVIKERKKFPGYVMAEVEWNDDIQYLFRETNGVGDFVGASGPNKPPVPMTEIEVKRMRGEQTGPDDKKSGKDVVVKLDFEKGDKVRIREGAFANMEGEVKVIAMPKEAGETPKVTVVVSIFGRPVDVDLDYWQVDKV